MYDLLIFAELVPEKTTILLAISKTIQIRRKEVDRNSAGIFPPALFTLWKYGYSLNEIKQIIVRNIYPPKVLETSTELLKVKDTLVTKKLKIFKRIFKKVPEYLEAKQNLYKLGIQKLREKQCNIVFLDYPFHPLLDSLERNSPVKKKTEELVRWIINTSENIRTDTLFLNRDKEVMHDLTHLNELGATQVSQYLSQNILPSLLSSRKNQRKKTKEYYLVIR